MHGKNGIELAKIIRQDNTNLQLIFITGFPDFISEGYDVSALHYLIKPVSEEKLHTVFDRATTNLVKSEKRLYITFDRQIYSVPLNQIYYQVKNKYDMALYFRHLKAQIMALVW